MFITERGNLAPLCRTKPHTQTECKQYNKYRKKISPYFLMDYETLFKVVTYL